MSDAARPDITGPEMRRFFLHMRGPLWSWRGRLFGASWAQACARLRAFGHPRPDAALKAFEAGTLDDFRDLKIVTAAMARSEDHARFVQALAQFDPGVAEALQTRGARFANATGIGGGSLNVYRFVRSGGEMRFEKVYAYKSACYRGMRFAHRKLLPRLEGVAHPALCELVTGERLALARFETIPYRRRALYDVAAAVRVVRRLRDADLSGLRIPPHARRLDRGPITRGAATIVARLAAEDPDRAARIEDKLAHWRETLAQFARVATHGDLNRFNISASGHVIDWDAAGVFPYGYDPAYVANHSTLFRNLDHLEAFLARHFARPGTAREDRIASLFFFVHFMQERPRQARRVRLMKEILAALERELG